MQTIKFELSIFTRMILLNNIPEEFNGNESSFITQSEEINGETEELKRLHGGQDCEGQRGQTVLGDTCGHLEATAQGIGVEVGHCGHD